MALVFIFFSLLIVFGLGLPVCRLLPASIPDRFAAAPMFGLAIFAVITTIAYSYGVLALATAAAVAVAMASLLINLIKSPDRSWMVILVTAGYLIGTVCLAPLWIGGWQFAIFQANPSDQFNYISMASIFSARSYVEVAQSTGGDLITLRLAASQLSARPAVAIMLAALRPNFFATTAEASYPYLAWLQMLTLYGVLFAVRNLFLASRRFGLLVATAFAVGFFAQYVTDINAWSSLAALGLAPTCVTLVFVLLTSAGRVARTIPLAIVAAGILYLYPESASICAVLSFVIVVLCLRTLQTERLLRLGYVVLSALIALIVCGPVWHATIDFMISQIATAHVVPKAWFYVFDRFYLGGAADSLATINEQTSAIGFLRSLSAVQIVSVACSAAVAFFGTFFIAPSADTWGALNILWMAGELLFVAALVAASLALLKRQFAAPVLFACIVALLLPAAMLARGDYWAAGKALSMLGPFTFLFATFPFLVRRGVVAAPALILILLHIGFGVQRLPAAQSETGVRGFGGYPGNIRLKGLYNWELTDWRARLEGCRRIAILIDDPFLVRLAETITFDLGLPTEFLADRRVDYASGATIPAQVSTRTADCSLTDHATISAEGHIINLSRPVSAQSVTTVQFDDPSQNVRTGDSH